MGFKIGVTGSYALTNAFAISGTNRTFCGWFDIAALGTNNAMLLQTDLSGDPSTTNGLGVYGGVITLFVGDGSSNQQISESSSAIGKAFYVGTIDGEAVGKIYKDLIETGTGVLTINPDDSANVASIGQWYAPNGNLFATFEDLRIYDRVLSADEMKAIYHGKGADNIQLGLVFRARCCEGADGANATVLIDVSGQGNNMTVMKVGGGA